MRKKGRTKYFLVIILCIFIFIYGFLQINITKPKVVRIKSKFTIDLSLEPVDLKIETANYILSVNTKFFDKMKEKYNQVYDGFFPK